MRKRLDRVQSETASKPCQASYPVTLSDAVILFNILIQNYGCAPHHFHPRALIITRLRPYPRPTMPGCCNGVVTFSMILVVLVVAVAD